jgi:hypothetical protein
VPDRLTIGPVDDGQYGLDAGFQGSSGYERAQRHEAELRFGPLPAAQVARALSAFVY